MKKNNISEKLEEASKQLDVLLNNRLVISIFMIVDGVNFIINPRGTTEFMARMIAFFAICASGAIIINNIKNKTKDLKSIVPATVFMIICIYILIVPKGLSLNIRVLVAIFIIMNALINIFNIAQLDEISKSINYAEDKLKGKFNKEEDNNTYNKKILLEQAEKIASPINKVTEKAINNTVLYIILNAISIFLGVILLTNDNMTIVICGIILIYTGLFDALMYLKSVQISKKLKDNQTD